MGTAKTESFESDTTTTTELAPNYSSSNKGYENGRKRSNGNTFVFVPGPLGENGVGRSNGNGSGKYEHGVI